MGSKGKSLVLHIIAIVLLGICFSTVVDDGFKDWVESLKVGNKFVDVVLVGGIVRFGLEYIAASAIPLIGLFPAYLVCLFRGEMPGFLKVIYWIIYIAGGLVYLVLYVSLSPSFWLGAIFIVIFAALPGYILLASYADMDGDFLNFQYIVLGICYAAVLVLIFLIALNFYSLWFLLVEGILLSVVGAIFSKEEAREAFLVIIHVRKY